MADFDINEILDDVRDGFSKFTKSAGDVTKNVVSAIEDKTQSAKLGFKLRDYENEIDELYAKIGKSVYKSYKTGDECKSLSECFEKIDEINKKITCVRDEISNLECDEFCPVCGAALRCDDAFCSKCGSKIERETL